MQGRLQRHCNLLLPGDSRWRIQPNFLLDDGAVTTIETGSLPPIDHENRCWLTPDADYIFLIDLGH